MKSSRWEATIHLIQISKEKSPCSTNNGMIWLMSMWVNNILSSMMSQDMSFSMISTRMIAMLWSARRLQPWEVVPTTSQGTSTGVKPAVWTLTMEVANSRESRWAEVRLVDTVLPRRRRIILRLGEIRIMLLVLLPARKRWRIDQRGNKWVEARLVDMDPILHLDRIPWKIESRWVAVKLADPIEKWTKLRMKRKMVDSSSNSWDKKQSETMPTPHTLRIVKRTRKIGKKEIEWVEARLVAMDPKITRQDKIQWKIDRIGIKWVGARLVDMEDHRITHQDKILWKIDRTGIKWVEARLVATDPQILHPDRRPWKTGRIGSRWVEARLEDILSRLRRCTINKRSAEAEQGVLVMIQVHQPRKWKKSQLWLYRRSQITRIKIRAVLKAYVCARSSCISIMMGTLSQQDLRQTSHLMNSRLQMRKTTM